MHQTAAKSPLALLVLSVILLAQLGVALRADAADKLPALQSPVTDQGATNVDWSKAVVESTMKRYLNPANLGSWGYAKALYLFGEYLVWKRTGDPRYLQYVKGWVDSHVDAQGNIDHNLEALDFMLPGNLLVLLYQEIKEEKYKLAADKIRELPQPGSMTTTERPATPASEAVKLFSSSEVRAAFEKGAPLVAHDGRNYSVLAGRRDKPGQAELHEKDLDVIYVVQGSATFVTGGKMVEGKTTAPGEVRGTAIDGGETHTLTKDDVIIVPPGVPHWFKDVPGVFFYFVVKVQQ